MSTYHERLPAGDDSIVRRMERLEREVRELRAARRLESATIGRGGLTVKGGGDITIQDGGTLEVTGDLILRSGIIGADALRVAFQHGSGFVSNFGLTTAATDKVAAVIPVPAWATQAVVLCNVSASCLNPRPVIDFTYLTAVVDGHASANATQAYGPLDHESGNFWATSSMSLGVRLVSLGATVRVAARMHANGAAWSADPANTISVNAVAIFRAD